MEVDSHYEAHGVAQASRAVNVDILDSGARGECEDWVGTWCRLWELKTSSKLLIVPLGARRIESRHCLVWH